MALKIEMTQRQLVRRALLGTLALLVALPWILRASQRGLQDFYNVPYRWVSAEFEPRTKFDSFLRRFGSPEVVVLSYPGCTVDDPRLNRLAERLTSDAVTSSGHRYRALFPSVATGYDALQGLTQPPLELSRQAALQRLQGILVGPDATTSCALISVSQLGADLRGQLIEIIRHSAAETVGLPPQAFVLAGGLLQGVEIDAESLRSSRLAIPSAAVSLIICILCLRSVWLSLPIFAVSMVGQGLVLAITDYSGIRMNAILMVLAPLVFTLTMSAGVHLANYYREQRFEAGEAGAMVRAVGIGWLPCALATLTTAIGLASLAVSEVIPVRQFGVLGAIGCMAAFAFLLLIFPGVIVRWPPTAGFADKVLGFTPIRSRSGRLLGKKLKKNRRPHNRVAAGMPSPALRAIGLFVTRHAYPISLLILLLMAVGIVGITRLRTSVDVLSLLPQNSRLVRDYRWLEQRLGPLVPLEFILQFDPEDRSLLIQRLEMLRRLQVSVGSMPELGGAVSALNFLPSIPPSGGVGATARRRVFNRRVEQSLETLIDAGYVAQDDQGQAWRLTVRTAALDPARQREVLAQLQQYAADALREESPAQRETASVELTGIMPLVHATQSLLLGDLTASFLTAFLIVGGVMITVTRSLRNGLIAMLPNLFPVVMVFGFLGWADLPVDIGTMMTASVALGIAVDGTLHFLLTFRRENSRAGVTVEAAVLTTLQRCGRAMGHAALICGLGLLVFCFSGFLPTQRFALMIFALLTAAFIGDVVLFPALLVGPFRRFYRSAQTPTNPPTDSSTARR